MKTHNVGFPVTVTLPRYSFLYFFIDIHQLYLMAFIVTFLYIHILYSHHIHPDHHSDHLFLSPSQLLLISCHLICPVSTFMYFFPLCPNDNFVSVASREVKGFLQDHSHLSTSYTAEENVSLLQQLLTACKFLSQRACESSLFPPLDVSGSNPVYIKDAMSLQGLKYASKLGLDTILHLPLAPIYFFVPT